MKTRQFVLALLLIYLLLEFLSFLSNNMILSSFSLQNGNSSPFRPANEIGDLLWIGWLTDLIWSFFFVYFFARCYQHKGIFEGIRYGIYIGLFWNLVNGYGSYMLFSLPYALVFEWVLHGFIINIILGIAISLFFKKSHIEFHAAEDNNFS